MKIRYILPAVLLYTLLATCSAGDRDTVQPPHEDTAAVQPPAGQPAQRGLLLKADGQGNAYRLINSMLGGTAVETPDCADPSFGHHIRETFDDDLHEYVFSFYLHAEPDNDRCINFDRQRVEIKTYDKSPDSLKAFRGDTMILRWKFRLDSGFRPSPSFTHIHQIKPADGDAAMPMITITLRYHASGDRVEIIHVDSKGKRTVLKTAPLDPFKGHWIAAEETSVYGSNGAYQLSLKRMQDDSTLLSYSAGDLDMWRNGTTFCRPKWGIYRSLNDKSYLRDEKVLFADFFIAKR